MRLNKYKVVGAISILLLVLTPLLNTIVNVLFRGNRHGFGSECLLWLFPIMILALVDSFSSTIDKHV